jgi:hypothetical protein
VLTGSGFPCNLGLGCPNRMGPHSRIFLVLVNLISNGKFKRPTAEALFKNSSGLISSGLRTFAYC